MDDQELNNIFLHAKRRGIKYSNTHFDQQMAPLLLCVIAMETISAHWGTLAAAVMTDVIKYITTCMHEVGYSPLTELSQNPRL